MKILAFDSAGLVASVAILEEDQIIAEYNVNYKKTHSQTLLPMLDEIVKMVNLDLSEIDALAVAAGPGSFTGLRIGSATVKGLGLALEKPVIPVPTMEGMAMQGWGFPGIICPIMDARRNQVYTGIYRFEDMQEEASDNEAKDTLTQTLNISTDAAWTGKQNSSNAGYGYGKKLRILMDQQAYDIDELLTTLDTYREKVLFIGDGIVLHESRLKERLSDRCYLAPIHLNRQRAAAVGALAFQYYSEGKYETADEHKPEYLKVSQAERERAEKNKLNR